MTRALAACTLLALPVGLATWLAWRRIADHAPRRVRLWFLPAKRVDNVVDFHAERAERARRRIGA